ncbi:spore coat protein U-like protein [Acinetobacter calcoaceticus]|uniref:Spore coat protein U-like protein n=1 Tax=Acinetobacter calcoaceticus TaxID=471 RepID=A0A4V2R0A0_ACICA|nr:spore coat protein U-like protein [Acinetobacter calcoaceticus]
MKTFAKLITTAAILTSVSTFAAADIAGQVDVKLNISTGCKVNGSEVDGNINNFGTLDFGKTSGTWTNVITAELQSNGTSGDLEVVCDGATDVPFTVEIDGGTRGDRTLASADTTITDKVNYSVYKDAGRTAEYVVNTPVDFTAVAGQSTKIPVFGSIAPNTVEKAQGEYKDTLLVNVSF